MRHASCGGEELEGVAAEAEPCDTTCDDTLPKDCKFAESGRAARPSGAAGANFLGGAVWVVFRENANCGDPPG